jgi:hypothetical protein
MSEIKPEAVRSIICLCQYGGGAIQAFSGGIDNLASLSIRLFNISTVSGLSRYL